VENAVAAVTTTAQLAQAQRDCRKVYVDPSLIKFAVKLAAATRSPVEHGLPDLAAFLSFGVSPRAPIHLVEAARALATLRSRTYVLPQDVVDLVPDVFRHRLVLTYEALAEGITADELIHRFLSKIPAPEKPLEKHVEVAAQG
jgi:MoxR-like ATPase